MTEHLQDGNLTELIDDYGNIPRLKSITLGELLRYGFKPKESILTPWLPTQSLSMVHAPRGGSKTHLSLGIAYAVASGGSFLVWEALKPRGVLFIDGEMPGHALQERAQNIVRSSSKEAAAPLIFLTPDLQENGLPNLVTVEGQLAIEKFIDDSIELIIVDNLSSLLRSGRENEAESWQPIQDWLLKLRARGKSVLLIHHSNKNGGQRGTSRKEDILDTVINLKKPESYTPEQGALFEVHFEKARYLCGQEIAPFEAQLTKDAEGKLVWLTKSLSLSTHDKVIDLARDGLTQMEIAKTLGVNKSTVSRHITAAKNAGLITEV